MGLNIHYRRWKSLVSLPNPRHPLQNALDSTHQPVDMSPEESTLRNLEISQAKCVFPPLAWFLLHDWYALAQGEASVNAKTDRMGEQ